MSDNDLWQQWEDEVGAPQDELRSALRRAQQALSLAAMQCASLRSVDGVTPDRAHRATARRIRRATAATSEALAGIESRF